MARKKLKATLLVAAAGCGLSVLGVVLPWSWLAAWMRMFGAHYVPADPMIVYAVRASSAAFVFIGIFFALVARDPQRFAPFLDLAIVGLLAVGTVCLVVGVATGMAPWYLLDVAFCWVLAVLMAAWRKPAGAF
ncbi:MAG TPA: hypothetical protein QGH10_09400 [Armatimonadota bacterium]|nr:hypothetical protein [Armatimonadota bacterium]